MDILIGFVIMLLLLVILGRGASLALIFVSGIVFLASVALLAFFLFCLSEIIFSRRIKGKYVRCEKTGRYGFKVAVYETAEGEVMNRFPSETEKLWRLLYKPEKETRLFYVKRRNRVYDRISFVTVMTGVAGGVITLRMTTTVLLSLL